METRVGVSLNSSLLEDRTVVAVEISGILQRDRVRGSLRRQDGWSEPTE